MPGIDGIPGMVDMPGIDGIPGMVDMPGMEGMPVVPPGIIEDQPPAASTVERAWRPRSTSPIASIAPIMASSIVSPFCESSAGQLTAGASNSARATVGIQRSFMVVVPSGGRRRAAIRGPKKRWIGLFQGGMTADRLSAFAVTSVYAKGRGSMMTAAVAPVERRERTRETIDKLLYERQQVLVLFCKVSGLEPYTPDKHKPVVAQLQEFCQVLVDYSAFGHFEIYDRIARGEERRSQVLRVAEEVYPFILETTNAAVAFNDRYDAAAHRLRLDHLPDDLSILGERLATRIEMEDKLIAALLARKAA
jgi:regulator of sigma D